MYDIADSEPFSRFAATEKRAPKIICIDNDPEITTRIMPYL
jgi:hypothetical protein